MFNQVVLVGDVVEIYEEHIDLRVRKHPDDFEDVNIIPVQIKEDIIPMILLNNVCGVKGHIDMSDKTPKIVCDSLTILDRRGKENERD